MEKIQMTIQNYRDAIDAFQNGAEVSINNEQVSFDSSQGSTNLGTLFWPYDKM